MPAICLLLTVWIGACKKDSNSSEKASLAVSKTSGVKIGEPVQFTLSPDSVKTVTWSVSPSTNSIINATGNHAAISFGAKGNYTITAADGAIITSAIVSVNDSVYILGAAKATTVPFSSGDQIKIKASRVDSGAVSGLIFSAQTVNSYPCTDNSLLAAISADANGYTINYSGVSVPNSCTLGTVPSGGFSNLYPISMASSTLTINVSGKAYSGTIVKTGNSYTISWPYTTGVTISPTSL